MTARVEVIQAKDLGNNWSPSHHLKAQKPIRRVRIAISTANAAFQDDNLGPELAGILRGLVAAWEQGAPPENLNLRDSNGNTVGKVTVSK